MNRQYIQIEIGNLARVCSQNAQGSGHYTPTPPLGASNGITQQSTAVIQPVIQPAAQPITQPVIQQSHSQSYSRQSRTICS